MEDNAYEMLKLDNQLCFALYVASRKIIKQYKPLLDPLGLTYTGYLVMLALWENDNISVKHLGERLFLDSGTLTPLLKRIEALGLVSRTRNSVDERTVMISLTTEGMSLKDKARKVPEMLLCSSDFDIKQLQNLLKMLHANFPVS